MNELKHKIEKELILLGYNPIHLGTHYLIESIYLIYANPKEIFLRDLMRKYFPQSEIKYIV